MTDLYSNDVTQNTRSMSISIQIMYHMHMCMCIKYAQGERFQRSKGRIYGHESICQRYSRRPLKPDIWHRNMSVPCETGVGVHVIVLEERTLWEHPHDCQRSLFKIIMSKGVAGLTWTLAATLLSIGTSAKVGLKFMAIAPSPSNLFLNSLVCLCTIMQQSKGVHRAPLSYSDILVSINLDLCSLQYWRGYQLPYDS